MKSCTISQWVEHCRTVRQSSTHSKFIPILCLLFCHFSLIAGTNTNVIYTSPSYHASPVISNQKDSDLAAIQESFIARDPLRSFEGTTYYLKGVPIARGPRIYQFEGKVVAVSKGMIVIDGWLLPPFSYMKYKGLTIKTRQITIKNFPYPVKLGQLLSRSENWVVFGGRDYDYGTVIKPEPNVAATNAPPVAAQK